ncbi:MAG: cyclic nucleotide-binding domain-containing protein [Deltaproteobacteria bacterium]|nr:cyclic nucleotide-binding domain-containing protein [Deltaproteobacteria bacterium]
MKEEELLFKKFGRFFAKGTVLFEEGQTCLGMFIIQKGRVRLFKKAGKKEMTIDILGPGDFFGEMGRPARFWSSNLRSWRSYSGGIPG